MNICTYFDKNYSQKGWACYKSITKFIKDFNFYVLCFDDIVYNQAKSLNVIPIKLCDLENKYPELLKAKQNRELKEYYATISPFLPKYIFDKFGIDVLFYSDADIAFWSNPKQMLDILDNKSLMVVDHGFEPPRANVRFNVGILGYRNDNYCISFLNWWGDSCLNWCRWITLPDGRMADQGYLNRLHTEAQTFNALCINPIETGINLGPWNAGMCYIEVENNIPKINGTHNLIAYHYHEFKLIQNGYYPTGWKLNKGFVESVYDPYYRLLNE